MPKEIPSPPPSPQRDEFYEAEIAKRDEAIVECQDKITVLEKELRGRDYRLKRTYRTIELLISIGAVNHGMVTAAEELINEVEKQRGEE